MGIPGLGKNIREHGLVQTTSLERFRLAMLMQFHKNRNDRCIVQSNKKIVNINPTICVAVDASLYLHKFVYSYGEYLLGFWNQIAKLIGYGLVPVYIFEGAAPVEKQDVINERMKKKKATIERFNNFIEEEMDVNDIADTTRSTESNSEEEITESIVEEREKLARRARSALRITRADVITLQRFLDLLGIKYLTATGEADALAVALERAGKVQAIMSEDMDYMAMGCKRMISISRGKVYLYEKDVILRGLNVTGKQFTQMCVLMGCDYTEKGIPLLEFGEALDFVKRKGINFLDLGQEYINSMEILTTKWTEERIPSDFDPSIRGDFSECEIIKFLEAHNAEPFNPEEIINTKLVAAFLRTHRTRLPEFRTAISTPMEQDIWRSLALQPIESYFPSQFYRRPITDNLEPTPNRNEFGRLYYKQNDRNWQRTENEIRKPWHFTPKKVWKSG